MRLHHVVILAAGLTCVPIEYALAWGAWHASEGNTRGWQLMTPAERLDHQAKVRSFTNYDDCRAYQVNHHRLMQERATERNMVLPGPGRDFCTHLKPPQDAAPSDR